ncbi:hypothetical protein BU055_05385 [Staphylococcus succinus]|nr:hypothetical protein BU055_05385 [Staphylococcus succinus]
MEIIYQSKLRITFTLIKNLSFSGLFIRQKTKESHRIIKYQALVDIFEEREISKFYKKIHREIALQIAEEYIENNHFVSKYKL